MRFIQGAAIRRQPIKNAPGQPTSSFEEPRVSTLRLELEANVALRPEIGPNFILAFSARVHLDSLRSPKYSDP